MKLLRDFFIISAKKVKQVPLWLWIGIVVFTILFTTISQLRHATFHTVPDLGFLEAPLWNTLQGDFFYSPHAAGNTIFGEHNHIILLLILPIYAIFQKTFTLFFLQSLVIALGAIPLYFLAKEILKEKKYAVIFTVAYLIYPTIWHVALEEVHTIAFSLPLLFSMLYFFQIKKWNWYYVFLVLSLAVKEDISLLTFALGIYIFYKGFKKQGMITILLSAFWFWFSLFVFVPFFSKGTFSFIGRRYGHLGNSMGEIIRQIIFHPVSSLSLSYGSFGLKFKYIYSLFRPLIFVSLLAPGAVLIAVPLLLENMFSGEFFQLFYISHHSIPIIPIIFFAGILGFSKIKQVASRKVVGLAGTIIIVASIASNISFAFVPLVVDNCFLSEKLYQTDFCKQDAYEMLGYESKRKYPWADYANAPILKSFLAQIPPDASVTSQVQVYPHLVRRKHSYVLSASQNFCLNTEYVVIDMTGLFFPVRDSTKFGPETFEKLGYSILENKGDVYLYHTDAPSNKCISINP